MKKLIFGFFIVKFMPKSPKVQKVDFGPGHIGPMKLLNWLTSVRTRGIRVEFPRNDMSLTVRTLESGQLDVT